MKPMINNEKPETVKVTAELEAEALRLEQNPELILRLVDLLFLAEDEGRVVPS